MTRAGDWGVWLKPAGRNPRRFGRWLREGFIRFETSRLAAQARAAELRGGTLAYDWVFEPRSLEEAETVSLRGRGRSRRMIHLLRLRHVRLHADSRPVGRYLRVLEDADRSEYDTHDTLEEASEAAADDYGDAAGWHTVLLVDLETEKRMVPEVSVVFRTEAEEKST